MKRKPRKRTKGVDLLEQPLTPIDITKFGGKDDPCFGKHHDLKAEECRNCGDSELCAIAMSHYNLKLRQKEELQNSFKDMEDTEQDLKEKKVRKYLKKKIEKGISENLAFKKASKRYDLPFFRIKEIYETK